MIDQYRIDDQMKWPKLLKAAGHRRYHPGLAHKACFYCLSAIISQYRFQLGHDELD